jgi:hypothetical protein
VAAFSNQLPEFRRALRADRYARKTLAEQAPILLVQGIKHPLPGRVA